MGKKMDPGSLGMLMGVADLKQAEVCVNFFTLGFLVRSSLGEVIQEEGIRLFDMRVPERNEYIRRRAIEKAKMKAQQPLGLEWITEEILQAAFSFGDQLFYGCL